MRCIFLVAGLAFLGCGKTAAPGPAAPVGKSAGDPLVARREADAQAAFTIDAACASIEEALASAKKLAPTAGGDAREALLDVAAMFDSAGATLADHDQPPPTIEDYRKSEAERSTERQRAVADALDALHELRDARGTLDDLSATVPPEFSKPLEAILSQTEEAVGAVEDAIEGLGGKLPPEDSA